MRSLLKSINHKNSLFKKFYKSYIEKLLENYKKISNLLNRTIKTVTEHCYRKQTNLWKVIN